MADPEPILDTEFDAQLRGLFAQAEKAIETRAGAASAEPASPKSVAGDSAATADPASTSGVSSRLGQLSLIQLLKPLVLGLETLSRATGDNTTLLRKLEAAGAASAESQKDLPAIAAELRSLMESRNAVSQSMFAALHEELKGYKDGFLLESIHRPIIRDLISLYDDVAEIQRQVTVAVSSAEPARSCDGGVELIDKLRTIEVNIEHNLGFIVEVLNRLEVTLMPVHTGKLDKKAQRAVAVEPTENRADDNIVVRSLKRGFVWRDRVLRAEEVVIKKWKEGNLVALENERGV
jgi:molecular chaperone GrpE (heat shock protein)